MESRFGPDGMLEMTVDRFRLPRVVTTRHGPLEIGHILVLHARRVCVVGDISHPVR